MALDAKTLLIAHILMSLVCLIVAWSTFRVGRRVGKGGPGLWFAGFACISAGLLGLGLRGLVPDYISVALANASLYTGIVCHLLGVQVFIDHKPWWGAGAAIVLAASAVHVALFYISPVLWPRLLVFSLTYVATNALCAFMLYFKAPEQLRRQAKVSALLYTAAALLYVFRFSAGVLNPQVTWLQGGFLENIYLLGSMVVFAGMVYTELQLMNGLLLAERDKAIANKALLLQEMNHRTKNNLVIAESLVNLEGEGIKDSHARESLAAIKARLHTISVLHDHLSRVDRGDESIGLHEYLETLVDALRPLGSHTQWDLELESVQVPLSMALPIGLVVNELLTNSLKYAQKGSRECRIQLALKQRDPRGLDILVKDNGPGTLPEHGNGLGHMIIDTLIHQLQGTISYRSNNGLEATIQLSLQPS